MIGQSYKFQTYNIRNTHPRMEHQLMRFAAAFLVVALHLCLCGCCSRSSSGSSGSNSNSISGATNTTGDTPHEYRIVGGVEAKKLKKHVFPWMALGGKLQKIFGPRLGFFGGTEFSLSS